MPGLLCCLGFSLVAASGAYSLMLGLLIAVASLVFEQSLQGAQASVVTAPGLQSTGSVAVAHGLSCSAARGIFPDQGSNPYLLHWQVDSSPLSQAAKPGDLDYGHESGRTAERRRG